MRELPLSQGRVALVDDADYERCAAFKWSLLRTQGKEYAARKAYANGRSTRVYLHRFILDAPTGVYVDHQDGDGLNDQRANLRLATNSQNQAAATIRKRRRSPYRGVQPSGPRWIATIWLNGRSKNLGRFDSPEEAARAYDRAAVQAHREFARPNFPQDNVPSSSSEVSFDSVSATEARP